jgi:hypothetical protein
MRCVGLGPVLEDCNCAGSLGGSCLGALSHRWIEGRVATKRKGEDGLASFGGCLLKHDLREAMTYGLFVQWQRKSCCVPPEHQNACNVNGKSLGSSNIGAGLRRRCASIRTHTHTRHHLNMQDINRCCVVDIKTGK